MVTYFKIIFQFLQEYNGEHLINCLNVNSALSWDEIKYVIETIMTSAGAWN